MAIREILTDKDPVLHKKCHPVTQFDEKLWSLLDDMRDTLADANGAGLAAPQIGILRRVVVVIDGNGEMLELINPELVEQDGEQDGLEGCLSVPGMWGYVKRPMHAVVKAQNRRGEWFQAEGEEIVARCFCHELEHLDGHVFTEHTDKLYTGEELDRLLAEEKGKR
ncbi:peptide deformylase [Vermiculatibacterium agrestimuris]|uniref:peptide deformylase n=1 Tax=Vermiculatibacterium agrestimuris TaxID=2941519 RepID=UPI00203D1DE9|nr:peptide deformylase [Vermiculatibacterium agrestimuris]